MAGDGQTGSEQSVMHKLAMALAVALVAGAAGYGIGAVAGPGLLKPADLPAAAEAVPTAARSGCSCGAGLAKWLRRVCAVAPRTRRMPSVGRAY